MNWFSFTGQNLPSTKNAPPLAANGALRPTVIAFIKPKVVRPAGFICYEPVASSLKAASKSVFLISEYSFDLVHGKLLSLITCRPKETVLPSSRILSVWKLRARPLLLDVVV